MNKSTFNFYSASGLGRAVYALLFSFALLAAPAAWAATAEHPVSGGADATHAVAAGEQHGDAHADEHHGLTSHAPVIGHIGPFPINNSMVLTWVVALTLILSAQIAMRHAKEVPDGAQNFWEWLVESLRNFLENILGRDLTRTTFWFFATLFIFILTTNWFGLIPGVGTIGWGTKDASGSFHLVTPLLRGSNADLNMTLAMAMIFFGCWFYWALKANGPGGFILHIFGPKGGTTGALKFLMIFVFIGVGLLEIVSILFRPISLAFRLYGNVFAGENMLESMATLVPVLAPIIPIPFYFMELLVGLVQALVFMLLTAVFTLLICTHEEGSHGSAETHH